MSVTIYPLRPIPRCCARMREQALRGYVERVGHVWALQMQDHEVRIDFCPFCGAAMPEPREGREDGGR